MQTALTKQSIQNPVRTGTDTLRDPHPQASHRSCVSVFLRTVRVQLSPSPASSRACGRAVSLAIAGLCFVAAVCAAEPIPGVTATATSSQVAKLFGPENVVNDHGLTDAGKGDGSRKLTTNGYADGGSAWHSGYIALGADERPIIQFDLAKVFTVGTFRVWNYNGAPQRGFKHVAVTCSDDAKTWRSLGQRFEFAMAPKSDDYTGEEYSFDPPLTARYIRFFCEASHHAGGQPDLVGLGKVRFFQGSRLAPRDEARRVIPPGSLSYPVGAGVIDVTAPPYLAKGDGQADDTEAIQRAITDWQGAHRTIQLPAGTYLISKPLRYKPAVGHGYNTFRGAGRDKTVLRLKDGTFAEAASPQPVFTMGFNGREDGKGVHADWFNNNVADLTVDTGQGNVGAIGLQFYSNNVGSLRDVTIRSGDGTGVIGLDLGYADQNGPCLVKNLSVDGFATGVKTGATVNSQTLEHVSIANATKVGWENGGQCLSIRGLKVTGPSPAFVSNFGVVCLIDAELHGTTATAEQAAITTHETLFARNIRTSGFKLAIDNRREKDNPTEDAVGPHVTEFVSTPPLSLFGSPHSPNAEPHSRSLNLPIQETPDIPHDDPATWANVRHFRELTDPDDTASIQRAIDSGATTVYFPSGGHAFVSETIEIRGNVRRVIGLFSGLHPVKDLKPMFRLVEGAAPVVIVQDFTGDCHIEHASSRTLVVKNGQGTGGETTGGGDLFLENVVADWTFGKGRVWARQFNNEHLGTHILNKAATLWILGLKTERGGTLIETQAGASTELLGGLSYTTNNGKLAPMFVSTDARVSYVIGEVCYTGDPYRELVRETRGSETKTLKRGDAPLRPSFLQGSQIPLYVGGK